MSQVSNNLLTNRKTRKITQLKSPLTSLLGIPLLMAGTAAAADNASNTSTDETTSGKFDWRVLSQCEVSREQLGLEQSTATVKDDMPEEGKVRISYDSAPEISNKLTHLKGNVTVQDHQSTIRAEEVIVDHQTQQLSATGEVSVESSDAIFGGKNLKQDRQTGNIELEKAEFFLFENGGRGTAESVTVKPESTTELNELTFTTCPKGDESWQLSTSEMSLEQADGRGEAWNTVLKVNSIPVFYFPYLNFPIDDRRKSGLLSPTIKNNDRNGLDIAQPIYWNITHWADATFTPRHIEKRGTQWGSQFRWLTEKTYSEWFFEWMDEDKIVASLLLDPATSASIDANSAERWLTDFKHDAVFNRNWQLKIHSQRVSDSDYFRDFGSGLESSNATSLNSHANLSYTDDIWDIQMFARASQSLIAVDSYRYLPSININADHLADSGFRWQLSSEWTQFEHPDSAQLEGTRTNLTPSLSYPMNAIWGFTIPKLSYQMTRYEQESQLSGQKQSITRDLPIFSLDSGLYFDRKTRMNEEDYTHSLIPRVFYSYIPHREQDEINNFDTTLPVFGFNQLWRENRFSGIDRVGDTNHVSVALTNTLVKDASGEQVFKFSLGRRYYFDDRTVQLAGQTIEQESTSPWLAELEFKLSQSTTYRGFIDWDERSENTNQARSVIKFEPKPNHIVNLSHRFREIAGDLIEESDFSFAWPINSEWRLLGRWYNDMNRDKTIEALAGIEYESCCWAVRLVAQKYLNTQLDGSGNPILISDDEYSDGIHLQFVFKGLGSAGESGLSGLLESSITSYRDPFLN
ncbi:LPS-assembly protein LptD [Aliikangiella coralliicola]|uniref:LPS-assembly protein LptD n=1 Tax=Aliikangiella coralliicola TaxID=2592383 RepID=A0A545UE29_9GAMM|nr:LPS assembly protein LptD [Aliikangiella coralliicola]TQV87720.1 LPS assembly protein LptD [Aliikangiella coralliicola]